MDAVTQSLYFTGPRDLVIREEPLRGAGGRRGAGRGDRIGHQRRHRAQRLPRPRSAVAPAHGPDTRLFLSDADADWNWPARYGYALVGRVGAVGSGVDEARQGRSRLHLFAPRPPRDRCRKARRSRWATSSNPELGVFFANINTAYNGVLDANPPLGADVVVSGLGVIGQIVVRLLKRNGARTIVAVDGIAMRRETAPAGGATHVLDPTKTRSPRRCAS